MSDQSLPPLPSTLFTPLDSLPYLDPPSHPDYAAYALTLIEEEMQKMLDSGEDCSEEKFLKGVREWRGRFSEVVEKGVEEVGENNGGE